MCLTPTALELSVDNEKETCFSKEEEIVNHQSGSPSLLQTGLIEQPQVLTRSTEVQSKLNTNDNISNHDVTESHLPMNNLGVPLNNTPNSEEYNAKFELGDCIASVNIDNLKMVSLLDFAGHSAYYACHHIFFSPRFFFILVVDMTKPLGQVARESCMQKDLIYSNWTYAGK